MIHTTIKDGTVVFVGENSVTPEDLTQTLSHYLQHPERTNVSRSLLDCRHADLTQLRTSDLRHLAASLSAHPDEAAKKSAIVVSSPIQFGLASLWQALNTVNNNQVRRIFMNIDQAKRWLESDS